MNGSRIGSIAASLLLACAAALPAQQPKVGNTQLKTEAVEQSLAATIDRARHANDQLWLAYEIQALPGKHLSSCSDWSDSSQSEDGCCGEYRLEDEHDMHTTSNDKSPQNVYILLRYEKGEAVKVRLVPAGCHLNAGGVNFDWITGVKPEESIAFLTGLVHQ